MTIDENLDLRKEFHINCVNNKEAEAKAIDLFKTDIVSFFNLCLFTYDPRQQIKDQPFILYPFQEDYVRKVNQYIIEGKSLLTEKSRDMGVTWMILGVFLYRWMFYDENFLIGSRKQELVDTLGNIETLFERLRYMINGMPLWLIRACGINKLDTKSFMKIHKPNQASIIGESTNVDFSRQGRFNAILLDEFASWDVAEQAWTAAGDTAPSKFVVSTPKGNHNHFARLKKSGQIETISLHWHVHPNKSQAWYEQQKAIRPAKDIAQELDINYTVSAGDPFYAGFIRGMHSRKLNVISSKELILGWDFGYWHPCCVISQISDIGRWHILDCVFGEKELIKDFADKVVLFLNQNFPKYPITNYGDPAGEQVNDKSTKTSAMWVEEITGVQVISKASNSYMTNYTARKNIIEMRLKQLIDGMPALLVNDIPRNQVIIEAFEGGWHYPEGNRHGYILEKPERENFYEHPMNCIDYIAVNVFSPIQETKQSNSDVTYKVVGDLGDVRISYEEEEDRYSENYIRRQHV